MTHWGKAAATTLVLATTSCDASIDQRGDVRLEVYSWWKTGGEKDALEELDRVNNEQHRSVHLAPVEAAAAEEAYRQLDASLAYRDPPSTFQANSGSNLLSRVIIDRDGDPGGVTDSRLEDLDSLVLAADEAPWPEVLEAVSVGGLPYGVPIDLHRINNLYFNVAKVGSRELPGDLPALLTLVAQLAAERGGPAFAIGVRDNWTLESLVFENILPATATGDPDFYRDFWEGRRAPDDEATRATLERTLEAAQELARNTLMIDAPNATEQTGSWWSAFDAMMDPASSVTFVAMGDWATGYLEWKGYAQGSDYDSVPFPGTAGLFIFTADVFPLPFGAPHPEETRDLLSTVLTWDAQVAFNRKKGSIPAVVTTPERAREVAPWAEARVNDFIASEHRVQAMSGLLTPDIPPGLLRDSLEEMLAEEDARTGRDIVLHALANHYWMFSLWTEAREQADR